MPTFQKIFEVLRVKECILVHFSEEYHWFPSQFCAPFLPPKCACGDNYRPKIILMHFCTTPMGSPTKGAFNTVVVDYCVCRVILQFFMPNRQRCDLTFVVSSTVTCYRPTSPRFHTKGKSVRERSRTPDHPRGMFFQAPSNSLRTIVNITKFRKLFKNSS